MNYALDTNTIVHLLIGTESVRQNRDKVRNAGGVFIIPPFVHYEIKRGLLTANATAQMINFDILCREFEIGEMSIAAWGKAAELYSVHRKKGQLIEDADIFIAAFCIVNGYTLVTNNVKHFEYAQGLSLVNWKE